MEVKDYNNKSNIIYLLPLAFIAGLVPLIVFAKKISVTGVVAYTWDKELDFFSYYKMVFFLIFTLLGVLSFVVYLKRKANIKKSYYYLLIQIYAIFIILSAVYSDALKVAFWGFPDRYEGMFVLLSYLIVLFLTINLLDHKKDFKFILGTIFISASVICLIGIFQYLGFDILTASLGEKLILPKSLVGFIGKLNPKFNYIFSTLYNPNYVGSYTGMLLPLLMGLYILTKEKRTKIVIYIFTLLIFSNWLGCLSRAGMVGGVFASGLLFLLIGKKKLVENWQSILMLGLGFIIVFTVMNYVGDGRLVDEMLSFEKEVQEDAEKLVDIKINGDMLSIITEDNKLKIVSPNRNKLKIVNGDDEPVFYNLNKETGVITFKDNRYKEYKLRFLVGQDVLSLNYLNKDIDFKIMNDNKKREFLIIGFMNRGSKAVEIESWGFENHEGFASHRGYIWSRSIPLLKDTIITGYGPDTYALYFPQFDVIGKLLNFGTPKAIVDKPHNMYLQIAINTGVISLLAVLLLFGSYIYSSIKLYWNREMNDFHSKVGLGILVGVVGYLVAGLFNDSVISVAPVFWTLLGMGISINLKLKKERIQE